MMVKKIQLYWLFPVFVVVLVVAAVVIIDLQINYFRESYFSALRQEINLRNKLIIDMFRTMEKSGISHADLQSVFTQQGENPLVLKIKQIGGPVVFETSSTPAHLRRILSVQRIRNILRGPAHDEVIFEFNPYFKTYFAYNAETFTHKNTRYVLLMAEQCESVTRLIKLSEFAVFVLSAMGFVLVGWLIFFFFRQLRSPLKRLKVSTRAIAGGDFDYPVYIPRSGVVKEIAVSVRDMAEHLKGQIVQLKKFEEQRREFFGAISHAMKTPLTGILSAVEGIEQGALDNPEYRNECIKAIKIQSQRLSGLLHDFLSINTIELYESKKIRDFLPVYISELLEEAAESFRHNPDVHIEVVSPEDEPEIPGNPVLLIQAFENLLSNAVMHGCADRIRCEVQYNCGNLDIFICDNGCGIPVAERELIFERLYRLANKKNELIPGNGLGLVIVKRVVELHNGQISVVDGNEVWKTVFKISLEN
ncbi:MAG: HAMP domain-containing histidine kinase [Lentisphaeria bacterium]|nr:HAMP domain-containing histidine kinase [Lentisphaeria bacterium]